MSYKATINSIKEDKNSDLNSLKNDYYSTDGIFSMVSSIENTSVEDLASVKLDKDKELKIWKQIEKLAKQSNIGKYL
tara:strand:+ start:2710 stop:2940 length:231 start_codon:yes stop_codon:yes gene_type:complete